MNQFQVVQTTRGALGVHRRVKPVPMVEVVATQTVNANVHQGFSEPNVLQVNIFPRFFKIKNCFQVFDGFESGVFECYF